jgi:catechol-2,3-dioxygenase
MLRPFKLGYADFAVKDFDSMLDYYTRVLGFSLVERGDNRTAYVSTGFDHHNISLTPASEGEMHAIGWQLDEKITLRDAAKELQNKGISSVLKSDARPGVPSLLELTDPDGNMIHLYNEMKRTIPGFSSTGVAPVKLGHIAMCTLNAKKVADFYRDVLNFWETDWIWDFANFLTCNKDHHTLNVAQAEVRRIHHIAYELRDFSHHRESGDVLAKNQIPIAWGPSRHTAGHNVASYHEDPDHNIIELYSDMDVFIPEMNCMDPRPWHEDLPQTPKRWETSLAWGTKFEYDLGWPARKSTVK